MAGSDREVIKEADYGDKTNYMLIDDSAFFCFPSLL